MEQEERKREQGNESRIEPDRKKGGMKGFARGERSAKSCSLSMSLAAVVGSFINNFL